MRLAAVAAVLVVTACSRGVPDLSSEPSPYPRRSTWRWSSEGWEGLRWGMGPGDVQVHVGPKGMNLGGTFEPVKRTPNPRLRTYLLRDSARRLGGETTFVTFAFLDDALFEVHEEPAIPSGDFERALRWAGNARQELARRWGEPRTEKGKDFLASTQEQGGRYEAQWRSGGVTMAWKPDLEREDVSARTLDPGRAGTVRDLLRAQLGQRRHAQRTDPID